MSGYELIDSGDQKKLERFGKLRLVRPCAQAVWKPADSREWSRVDAHFRRHSSGTGEWRGKLPEAWTFEHAELEWEVRPNEYGNLGIFAEQTSCWEWIREQVAARVATGGEPPAVINLFGYTGGSTLAASAAGAAVCHVDASKTSVRQARTNASLSRLAERPIRWIVEDALLFVEREIRRGRRYQGMILDPPTYGRGPNGEVWKIDDGIVELVERCREVLADGPSFFLLTSHSPGYTPIVLENLIAPGARAEVEGGEMTIIDRTGRSLPSGAFARWSESV